MSAPEVPARRLGDVLHVLIDAVPLPHESTAVALHAAVDGYVRSEESPPAEWSTVDSSRGDDNSPETTVE
jgi:hypothetical protein